MAKTSRAVVQTGPRQLEMREHGVRRIYTRDTDFHRLPFLEVVDPLERE